MTRNTIETVMGAVTVVAGVFLWLAYSVVNIRSSMAS